MKLHVHQLLFLLTFFHCKQGLLGQAPQQPSGSLSSARFCRDPPFVPISHDPRTFGNVVAAEGRHPYMVSLVNRNSEEHQCGGVLISSSYVLTAAHCVATFSLFDVELHIGLFFLDQPGERKYIAEAHYPPGWAPDRRSGKDIALLKLSSPSSFHPIRLPGCILPLTEKVRFASLGWGRSSSSGGFATELRLAWPKFIATENCTHSPANLAYIGNEMMCAGQETGGICTGDEGSPTILQGISVEKDLLVGIASFRDGACGNTDIPGVYTRVDHYIDWIKKYI